MDINLKITDAFEATQALDAFARLYSFQYDANSEVLEEEQKRCFLHQCLIRHIQNIVRQDLNSQIPEQPITTISEVQA